ncbi:MAG: DNA-binding response regulator [Deltaproteobacteria bacterium]|nr:MAG: DNA-binding response regulator [Deltaproteobacteria bacterium]
MRVLIVEDNTALRESLVMLLSGEDDFEITGSYGTAEEAMEAMAEEPPDILLVDLGLPGMSGTDLIKWVKENASDVDIMVHTIFDDRDNVFSAIKAGASSYILKGAKPRELVEAILDLRSGGAPMSPKIARAVIGEFQEVKVHNDFLLTVREKEVLVGLERGLTYKELAERMNVSHHTVHTHIKHIYEKLQAKGRREALSKAKNKGII